jgi:hypothetical protein
MEQFGVIREGGRNLEISKDTILKSYYGSKTIHLLFNLWYDFNYQPAYTNNEPQADHIFPQKLLKEIKKISPETGRMSMLKYQWKDRDQIANLMLLKRAENGPAGKSDTPLDEWLKFKETELGELGFNDYLNLHLIPKDKELWKLENFEKFIEARKYLILQKFDYLLLKQ